MAQSRKRFIYTTTNPLIIGLIFLLMIAVFWLLGAWYYHTGIPHTYPDGRTNFWFGFLHGILIVPSFIFSWFDHDPTIYQAANDGFSYNLGFMIGIGGLMGSARAS